ncbi:MAG: diguanylate cyclase domain-containing protein [Bulleidia sp.]
MTIVVLPVHVYGESEPVRVGYTIFENYQEGKDGEYKRGFGYEYLQRIAYSTGWTYEYVYGSFSELLEMLKRGEIDIMGDLSYNAERAQYISYSSLPQGRENYYIYAMSDCEDIDPMELDTLNGKTIGVVTGTYQYGLLLDYLEEESLDVSVVEYASSSEMAQQMQEGQVDAMVMTDMASSGKYLPIVSIGSSDFYIGVNQNRPDLLSELNTAMREIQISDPYYNDVTYSKYIAASSLSNTYLSQKERAWLEEQDYTITMGYLDNNLPYCDMDDDGNLTGLYSILADKFESLFGITVNTVPYETVADMDRDKNDGKLDLFGPLYRDAWLAEQNDTLISNAVNTTTFVVLYNGEKPDDMTKIIAYSKNNSLQYGALEVLFPDSWLLECESRQDCMKAILEGRAGSMLASSSTLNHLKKYPEMSELTMMELPNIVEIAIGTPRENSELLNITNRVINACSEDFTGAALMDYTYEKPTFSFVEYLKDNSLYVIGGLVVIIALLAYYVNMQRKITTMERQTRDLNFKAFRDALTRTGNRAGYFDQQKELQKQMDSGSIREFAVVIADINNLKKTNDTYGHDEGDILIKNASGIICHVFEHSPVYRIGGDEFAVILTGQDYEMRYELLDCLEKQNRGYYESCSLKNGEASISYGMAEYHSGTDTDVKEIFGRADQAMYRHKKAMKAAPHHTAG